MNEHRPILATVVTIVWGLALFPGAAFAMMSPMMFDAPGSEKSHYVWMLFYCVLSFPVLCVVSIVASWIVFGRMSGSETALARVLPIAFACLPLIPVAIFAIAMLPELK